MYAPDSLVFSQNNIILVGSALNNSAVTVLTEGVRKRESAASVTTTYRQSVAITGAGAVSLVQRFYDGKDPGARVVASYTICALTSGAASTGLVDVRSAFNSTQEITNYPMTPYFDVALIVSGVVTACTIDRIATFLRYS